MVARFPPIPPFWDGYVANVGNFFFAWDPRPPPELIRFSLRMWVCRFLVRGQAGRFCRRVRAICGRRPRAFFHSLFFGNRCTSWQTI